MAQVLVLGGTSWLGGAVAASALAGGHEVTCLARGEAGAVPDGATLVRADRDDPEAYAALPRRADGGLATYDLVVDVARQPGHVRGALAALASRAARWVFVSSCSVYARQDEHGADEGADLLTAVTTDLAPPEQYGGAKVACEAAVTATRGADALIARSGLIVGRGDTSDRFGYWPSRFALAALDGGPVLVPSSTDRPVQWVDVDDLADWLVRAGLTGQTGILNAMGAPIPLSEVLDAAAETGGFEGERVPASDAELSAAGVEEFMGPRSLPLWLPDPEWSAFLDRDAGAARAAGLGSRPLADTLAAALEHERAVGLDRHRERAGLDRDDELSVIRSLPDAGASRPVTD